MRYRWHMRWVVSAALVLCACKSAPRPVAPDAEAVLAESERLLQQSDFVGARDRLLARTESEFPKPIQARWSLAVGRAWMGLGQPWEAYLALRDFADHHPHSELREQVAALLYQAGHDLATSGGGFLFFWSDRRGGRTCLQHLTTRYPDSQYLADALRMLGEMAMEDGEYDTARDDFREILVRRPDSEWAPLARFRFAMSLFASLRGPEYDLDQMQHATKELRDFLANPPEKPEMVRQARATLQQVLEWQAQRHLLVANFYRTIDNRAGELLSLQRAADPEFAATPAAETARERLEVLGQVAPAPPKSGGP